MSATPYTLLCALAMTVTSATVHAVNPANPAEKPVPRKASFVPPAAAVPVEPALGEAARRHTDMDEVLVFSAPPRETPEEGERIYGPVAEYLARATGRRIVYRHPGNWLTYQSEMLKGSYDLVFDGPHFNSWRIAHLQHNALARLQEEHVFAVIARKDDHTIKDIRQLAGKRVCALNPPNLGTLAFLSQFDNPARQPLVIDSLGWYKVYEGVVIEKRCAAGVLPLANLKKYDGSAQFTRILYQTPVMPNQALSAGPRVTPEDQARIAAALLAPQASEATAALRAAYGSEKGFAAARKEEYAGLDSYLKDIWAFTR